MLIYFLSRNKTPFNRANEKCKKIYKKARLYEPRDYHVSTHHVMEPAWFQPWRDNIVNEIWLRRSSFAAGKRGQTRPVLISFQAFTKVRGYLEEVGKKGEVYWVGTRKKKGNKKRYVFGTFN